MTEPPKPRRGDHVIMDTSTGNYVLRCLRCGGEYTPALPIGVRSFVGLSKGFFSEHRSCRKPKEPKP